MCKPEKRNSKRQRQTEGLFLGQVKSGQVGAGSGKVRVRCTAAAQQVTWCVVSGPRQSGRSRRHTSRLSCNLREVGGGGGGSGGGDVGR